MRERIRRAVEHGIYAILSLSVDGLCFLLFLILAPIAQIMRLYPVIEKCPRCRSRKKTQILSIMANRQMREEYWRCYGCHYSWLITTRTKW